MCVRVFTILGVIGAYSKYVFYRKLSTGDSKDKEITFGLNSFVWIAGSRDQLSSSSVKGTFKAKIVNSTLIGSD